MPIVLLCNIVILGRNRNVIDSYKIWHN